MKPKLLGLVCLLCASTATFAQGPAPGADGKGMMHRNMPQFGSGNTHGWGMMSREERDLHRRQMASVQTYEQCQQMLAEHRKAMEARAKERGAAAPRGPRRDMCELMKQRGMFK